MTLVIEDRVVASAHYSEDAAANRGGAWIVSTYSARLLGRNEAIAALTLVERLAIGYPDHDPFVMSWREELNL